MINVNVKNGILEQDEINAYIEMGKSKYPNSVIKGMDITVDGDFVDIKYHTEAIPFERIRRITGYLVGDMSRWNNAKRSEESDRVKHGI